MYSPDVGDAACAPKANIDKKQTSKKRFIMAGDGTIYAGHEIFPCLPFSNQRKLVAANQRFRGQRARVIVGCHHKTVRASAHDGEQIAFMEFWYFPIQRKEIA